MRTEDSFIDPVTGKKYIHSRAIAKISKGNLYVRKMRGWYDGIDLIKLPRGIYFPEGTDPNKKYPAQ